MRAGGKSGENFLLEKIFTYTVVSRGKCRLPVLALEWTVPTTAKYSNCLHNLYMPHLYVENQVSESSLQHFHHNIIMTFAEDA